MVAALFTLVCPGVGLPVAANEVLEFALRSQPSKPAHPLGSATDGITLVRQEPVATKNLESGVVQLDFGRVAFGNVELTPPAGFEGEVVVRFGEKLRDGAIDREPPGCVRFSEVRRHLAPGRKAIVAPPADERNTRSTVNVGRNGNRTPPAALTPPEWGVLTPFRWIEIKAGGDMPGEFQVVRRAAFPKHWDDNAASFECSNETINRVWDLCRYSIKATLYAGLYVDGDRERIPYEADAYLNQLSHYYTDADPSVSRRTFDWLLKHPTWPSEWGSHLIFMAHADWMHNGDADWVASRYEYLKSRTLTQRCGDSGLVESNDEQASWNDIIDWPPCERDGYVRTEVNTVINAFHLAEIERMAEIASAAGADEDAERYANHAKRVRAVFNRKLFDAKAGRYRDGLGVKHHSSHASFFPLAFGLVPRDDRQELASSLAQDGMRCSVYAAQYFLEALFQNNAGEAAVELMIAPGERSWRHMLDRSATITWEAWNESVKPNLDWNHAWGAAPANLLPRYVLGAQPLAPGWSRALIRPIPSGLNYARGVVPTPHGALHVDWRAQDIFTMRLSLPEGVSGLVQVPAETGRESVYVDGLLVEAQLQGGYWRLRDELTGESKIEVR